MERKRIHPRDILEAEEAGFGNLAFQCGVEGQKRASSLRQPVMESHRPRRGPQGNMQVWERGKGTPGVGLGISA